MLTLIQDLIQQFAELLGRLPNAIPLLFALVIGIALVGWGYTLFRVWLLSIGLWAGYQLADWLVQLADIEGDMRFLIVVLFTLAVALFLWLALRASIFVAAFILGAYIVRTLGISILGIENRWVLLLGGLLAAVLAAAFVKLFIIAATAISGAYLTVDAIHGFVRSEEAGVWLNMQDPARNFVLVVLLLLWIAIAFFGIAYQYRLTDRGKHIRLHGTTNF
ncbi:MAG: DUF4203 domain-containing protein [Bacillota bacterium]|nr:DUF4203 domain-containing protein [Bacillota bacterium]